jgi:hypothetical protein
MAAGFGDQMVHANQASCDGDASNHRYRVVPGPPCTAATIVPGARRRPAPRSDTGAGVRARASLRSPAVSLPAPKAHHWHAARSMNVRTVVVTAGIISVGLLAAACAGGSTPADGRPSPSRTTAPSEAPTTPAAAPGMSWLRVAPQEGLRGATVKVDVACLDDLGAVHSPVLDIGALQPDPNGHQPWHLFGTAMVRPDAAPGSYPVSAACGAQQLSATFTVVPHP